MRAWALMAAALMTSCASHRRVASEAVEAARAASTDSVAVRSAVQTAIAAAAEREELSVVVVEYFDDGPAASGCEGSDDGAADGGEDSRGAAHGAASGAARAPRVKRRVEIGRLRERTAEERTATATADSTRTARSDSAWTASARSVESVAEVNEPLTGATGGWPWGAVAIVAAVAFAGGMAVEWMAEK